MRVCISSPLVPLGFQGGSVVKNPPTNAVDIRDACSIPGEDPWTSKWEPTPVFLPGKSHGQRSLVSYSPWGRKGSDMTEETQHAPAP